MSGSDPGRLAGQRGSGLLAMVGGLALVLALAAAAHGAPPGGGPAPERVVVELVRAAIAAAGALLLATGMVLRRVGRAGCLRRSRHGLLVGLALLTVVTGWYPNRGGFNVWFHPWDAFHYYVGGKYFRELGYTRLYECAVVADVEAGHGARLAGTGIRNLETNRIERVDSILDDPDRCKRHFRPARWRAFQRDVDWWRQGMPFRRWARMRIDHGYNPPPAWGMLGTLLTNTGPASRAQLLALASIDLLLLGLMFGAIAWAFGWQAMCIALIYWGTNQPARWEWIGGSVLRYGWLAASVGGICCLRRQRPGAGGLLLAYASCLRMFPVMIAAAVGLQALVRMARERSLRPTPAERRFALTFAAGAALVVGLSSPIAGGAQRWVDFVENSRLHLSTPANNLVGLPSLLAYHLHGWSAGPLRRVDREPDAVSEALRPDTGAEDWILRALVFAAYISLLGLAASRHPDWVVAVLGVGLIPVTLDLSSYYLAGLLAFAALWTRCEGIGVALLLLSATSWLAPGSAMFQCFSLAILVFVFAAILLMLRAPPEDRDETLPGSRADLRRGPAPARPGAEPGARIAYSSAVPGRTRAGRSWFTPPRSWGAHGVR
jgi:hypothetical protein